MYKIAIATNELVYEGKGKTAVEALFNVDLDYIRVKTKGTVKLSKGTKTSERFFQLRPLRMLIVNKLRKAQLARDLELLLK